MAFLNWAMLFVYGLAMFVISPTARGRNREEQFFQGRTRDSRETGILSLTSSVLIGWIFAKSVQNAADLGQAYGLPGGVAYAAYWLAFPVAGVLLYRLRGQGYRSIHDFLEDRFGREAIWLFSLIIGIRLWNEIWSNTIVVAQYFGPHGSPGYFAATWAATGLVLLYVLKGGVRSSIVTDVVQMMLAAAILVIIMAVILPQGRVREMAASGTWTLSGGVDLILVALLQVWSYPFHDPVMTDRAFITDRKAMLKAFALAGFFGVLFILLFSFVGIYNRAAGIGGNSTLATAAALGLPVMIIMNLMMITSATSTMDSAFASSGKLISVDLFPGTRLDRICLARWAMVALGIVGNAMVHAGPSILSATTVSGTMVIGFTPVFLLAGWKRPGPWSYYVSVGTGLAMGLSLALGLVPYRIGPGKYGPLLWVNLVGVGLCFAGYLLMAALKPSQEVKAVPRGLPASQGV